MGAWRGEGEGGRGMRLTCSQHRSHRCVRRVRGCGLFCRPGHRAHTHNLLPPPPTPLSPIPLVHASFGVCSDGRVLFNGEAVEYTRSLANDRVVGLVVDIGRGSISVVNGSGVELPPAFGRGSRIKARKARVTEARAIQTVPLVPVVAILCVAVVSGAGVRRVGAGLCGATSHPLTAALTVLYVGH